ncbi:MAG: response regulator transcription factor [Phototrophicaceae bacterium]
MTPDLRVLIVSDNLLTRAGLAALLDTQDDILVVGQITTSTLPEELDLYRADMIVCDLGWQASDSIETLSQIDNKDIPILVLLTDENDSATLLNILNQFPVYGLLLNENDSDILMIALQTVANGLIVIDPNLSSYIATSNLITETITEDLTQRENEVLQLLAQGLTNKAIALQLGITDHTVKFHVNAIMTKLNAQSRTEAVIIATRAGLIIL